MTLTHLIRVLRSRALLIAFVAIATVLVGAWLTLAEQKQYVATASLLLNFGTESPLEDSTLPPQFADSYIATQVDIITSRNVVFRAIDDLGLAEDEAQRRAWAARLVEHLEVEAGRDSRVINVHYESSDPEESANVANAFANAYVGVTQHFAVEPAKRNTQWFDAQLEAMRSRLGMAQSRLTEFQREKGIVSIDEKLDTETTRLTELNNQLIEAQASLSDVRSRQLGVNHPDYRRAAERLSSVQQSLEEQKQRVLSLKQQRDELQMLAREVAVEEQAYEGALQSYYNEQLRSTLNQTRVQVLDPAMPPDEPSSPKVALNLAGSGLLGIALACLFAIGAELTFRKIRTTEDISEHLDTKVLGKV